MVKIAKFPDERALYGNLLDRVSPLDRFYWCGGLGNYIDGKLELSVDPKKVFISVADAEILYRLHRDFVASINPGGDSIEISADLWFRVGPTVLPSVPKGVVAMADGYLSIDDDGPEDEL